MMFSATSLAESRSADGDSSSGSVPLMGLDTTTSPTRLRNNSGDNDATAPHPPETNAARAGAVRATASAKKSTGEPVTVPTSWVQTHAWYTSPAAMASRQASTPARWASRSASAHTTWQAVAGGSARSASASQLGGAEPERLSYHQVPSASWRSTSSVQPPAASGIRGPDPSRPASG